MSEMSVWCVIFREPYEDKLNGHTRAGISINTAQNTEHLVIALLEVAISVLPCIRLAAHEILKRAQTVRVRAAEDQVLQLVVHEDPDILAVLALVVSRAGQVARETFDGHARAERHHAAGDPAALGVHTSWVGRVGDVEQAHGGEHGDHEVLVREVRVDCTPEGEGQGGVVLRAVLNGPPQQAREELVHVAHPLDGAEGVTVAAKPKSETHQREMCDDLPCLVVLLDVAVVFHRLELAVREEVAERTRPLKRDSLKRAKR